MNNEFFKIIGLTILLTVLVLMALGGELILKLYG
jgi:hypothetical protein